jgi:hypothetical protein
MALECYVVSAGYDHEGSTPVAVYAGRGRAEAFAAEVNAYCKTRPRPDPAHIWDCPHSEEYQVALRAWEDAHPLSEYHACDYCEVTAVELR